MQKQLYKCELCKQDFSFEFIHYSTDGKKILCKKCFAKSSSKEEKLAEPDVLKLICVKCHFKFTRKPASKVSLRCPYCNGTKLMKDEATVEKLLADSGNEI